MITADTITNEQIRELARTALTASDHKACRLALLSAREALTSWVGKCLARTYPTRKERRAARARCAQIVNARKNARAKETK